jgi:hypothetical protein
MMTSRVPMVSLEGALELGEAMGLPARRTQSEAFRALANNPGVARDNADRLGDRLCL